MPPISSGVSCPALYRQLGVLTAEPVEAETLGDQPEDWRRVGRRAVAMGPAAGQLPAACIFASAIESTSLDLKVL